MRVGSVLTAIFFIFSVLLVASTCTAQTSNSVNWQVRSEGEVAPGYLLRVKCLDDAKLNGDFRVGFDGKVALPYGVNLDTTGVEVDDLNDKFVKAYRSYFKSTPGIQVSVVEKKYWVDVRGLVQKAGKYLVTNKSSLDEIIAKAGALRAGTGPTAKYVKIQQLGQSATLKLSDYYRGVSDSLIPEWQGGEIVFFQSEGIAGTPVSAVAEENIQLLGQVALPGEYRLKAGADFMYYLIKAGGPATTADLEKLEIIRIENGERKAIQFSLDNVEDMPALRGGDIVIVHTFRESRTITNFTSIIAAITSVALLFLV